MVVLVVKNQIFENTDVPMDDHHFIGCTFRNVNLILKGTAGFNATDCTFDGFSFLFDGPAAATISMLAGLYVSGFQPMVEQVLQSIRTNSIPLLDRKSREVNA